MAFAPFRGGGHLGVSRLTTGLMVDPGWGVSIRLLSSRPLVCHRGCPPPVPVPRRRARWVFLIELACSGYQRSEQPRSEARLEQRFPICDCVTHVSRRPDSIKESPPPSLLRTLSSRGRGALARYSRPSRPCSGNTRACSFLRRPGFAASL